MKAAVLEAVKKIAVQNIAAPQPRPDEVVIKVKTCGMCGTDLKLFTGEYTARVPVVPGHEYAGEIVEVGKEVRNLRVGQRVVSDPNESCGKCYWCRNQQPCFCNDLAAYGVLRDGGFAEYCTASEKGVYPIPEGVDDETAAFAEPVSCVVHAVDRAAYRPGETVVIFGFAPEGRKATFIPFNLLYRELTILGSWVNPYSYSRALEVLAAGRIQVKPLISNRLTLDEISDAYTLLEKRPAGFMKSLVSP